MCGHWSWRTPTLSLSTLPSLPKCHPRCCLVSTTWEPSWRLANTSKHCLLLRWAMGVILFWPNGRRSQRHLWRLTRCSSSPMCKGLSIYYPTHSWPDSASVVDGVWRDWAWWDSGSGSLSVDICVHTLLIHTFIGHHHKALWGSSTLNGWWTHDVHCHNDQYSTAESPESQCGYGTGSGQSLLLCPKETKGAHLFVDIELTHSHHP